MKAFQKTLLATSVCLAAPLVFAHDDTPNYLPEGHAPAGVMADHLHAKGEWMFGYHAMREEYSDVYSGSDKVGAMELGMAGYSMIPTGMTMDMHMLDIMYAVSDDLTLMLMPQYMTMDMSMEMIAGGHGHMGDMHGDHKMGGHRHDVSGVGDTVVGGLFRLADTRGYRLHATLGLSAPTGSVDEKNADGAFTHYGMQLGTGTWDLLPSITYTSALERLSWGAQLSARLPLEDENDSGFAFGERYGATAWSAYRLADWISLSARLQYAKEGDVDGHYNGPHNHSSPADLQGNYGGELLDYGLGVNLVGQQGALAGCAWGSSGSAIFPPTTTASSWRGRMG
ncbi:hypothetical protein [Microbulbifer taiwanensis]|uniref:hypothetical protein n=1 Tax=Microbulbifer taiwanensis TaxID=986746 RepID=UPI00361AFFEC